MYIFMCKRVSALVLLAGIVLGGAASARGDDLLSKEIYLDLRHTMLVREALLRDPELAPLNIGVRVEKRAAVLWGPVPSQALLQKALRLVRNMPDIRSVQHMLHVVDPNADGPLFLPPAAQRAATSQATVWQEWFAPTQTTTAARPAAPAETALIWQPARTVETTAQWMPALPARPESAPAVATSSTTARSLPAVDESVLSALRQSAERFAGLRLELGSDFVYIHGNVLTRADAQEFASLVARVPGVQRVVLGPLQVASAK